MDLLREQTLGETVQGHELLGEFLGGGKTFGHEHVLANEHNVGNNHCARSEKGLKVLGQLSSSGITRVHGDEESNGGSESNLLIEEEERVLGGVGLLLSGGVEAVLDLGGDHREHFNGDSVELVEASPGSSLGETHEDLGHGKVVHLIRAVEHHNLETEGSSEILGGLSLSCSGGTGGSSSHRQVEGLSEGDVASIS